MEIYPLRHNIFCSTAQGILLVLARGTDEIYKKVKLQVVLVPGLIMNIFSSPAAAQKDVKAMIAKNGLYLGLGQCCVQLIRFDSMDHIDLTIAKTIEEQSLLFVQLQEKHLEMVVY